MGMWRNGLQLIFSSLPDNAAAKKSLTVTEDSFSDYVVIVNSYLGEVALRSDELSMNTLRAVGFALASVLCTSGVRAADVRTPETGDQFDIAIQAVIANDNMSYGVTNTDHGPYGSININPTYGIFYGNLFAERLKYTNSFDAGQIDSQVKFQLGMALSFGPLSLDLNVQRKLKLTSSSRYVTVPFVTATYAFNEQLSTSLGVGYYFYDQQDAYANTPELYGALDVKPADWLSLHGEATYDFVGLYNAFPPVPVPSAVGNTPYLEVVGSVAVSLPKNFTVTAKLGFENFFNNAVWPDYKWYDVGLDYAMNNNVTLGLHYQGNDLSTGSVNCSAQSWNLDCDSRIIASLTLRAKASELRNK